MARIYIHERADWPRFTWGSKALAPLLSAVRLQQGLLLGKMRSYGFASQWSATLKVLTEETIKSSAIEGVVLDPESVRSSIAKRLGLDVAGFKEHKERNVVSVVEMIVPTTQRFNKPPTKELIIDLHPTLFAGVPTTSDKYYVWHLRDGNARPQ